MNTAPHFTQMEPRHWRSCLRKLQYSSRRAARIGAVKVRCAFGTPMRVYRCAHCRKWHLTSKPREERP
jgi:hypothetical protein